MSVEQRCSLDRLLTEKTSEKISVDEERVIVSHSFQMLQPMSPDSVSSYCGETEGPIRGKLCASLASGRQG